jgi:hypothetical protein
MLDALAVKPNRILLLDTFFQLVVFHGETIAAWKNQRLQEQTEYEYFAQFLQAPQADATAIMSGTLGFDSSTVNFRTSRLRPVTLCDCACVYAQGVFRSRPTSNAIRANRRLAL